MNADKRKWFIQTTYYLLTADAYLLIPFMKNYSSSGKLSIREKTLESVKKGAFYYLALVCLILVAIIVVKFVTGANIVRKQAIELLVQIANILGFISATAIISYSFVYFPTFILDTLYPEFNMESHFHLLEKYYSHNQCLKFEIMKIKRNLYYLELECNKQGDYETILQVQHIAKLIPSDLFDIKIDSLNTDKTLTSSDLPSVCSELKQLSSDYAASMSDVLKTMKIIKQFKSENIQMLNPSDEKVKLSSKFSRVFNSSNFVEKFGFALLIFLIIIYWIVGCTIFVTFFTSVFSLNSISVFRIWIINSNSQIKVTLAILSFLIFCMIFTLINNELEIIGYRVGLDGTTNDFSVLSFTQ